MRNTALATLLSSPFLFAGPPAISRLPDHRTVKTYTLSHASGISATVSELGATIRTLRVPDREGKLENILSGHTTDEAWLANRSFYGSTVGRYANRIAKGTFTLDGNEYTVAKNNGENHLHGGITGFDKVLWDSSSHTQSSIKFTYLSPDGEEGYPGNLRVTVEYALGENSLTWKATATTDRPTPVNLTNHAYFNLTGDMDKPVLDHILHIASDGYLSVDRTLIPTGETTPVASTGFDFNTPAPIGENLAKLLPASFDHNYVLKKRKETQPAAIVRDPASGRTMELSTDQPGLQFYLASPSGNKHAAFCLEPQKFPDSPNRPAFPSSILRPGETYSHTITLRFPQPR